jgi:hypothetical protein
MQATDGDKVLVTEEWSERLILQRVTKYFGKAGEHNTEIHAILADYMVCRIEFPKEVGRLR